MIIRKKAFTLIEIIVAVSIIIILLTISIFSYSEIRSSGRNFKRISDIGQLQIALETYRRDTGSYPEFVNPGESLVHPNNSQIVYLNKIPSNPSPRSDGPCSSDDYIYHSVASGTSYKIDFCIGKNVNEVAIGSNCATPDGIISGFCGFVCERDNVYYENDFYPTVLIGEQCWLTKNLNIGTMISGASNQANNSIIEKYCYNNDESNCDIYGGLYQWNEAMQYVGDEGAQGICPDGWKIPTNDDFFSLTDYLGGALVAGGKLKSTQVCGSDPCWNSPNTGATDEFGFSAISSGMRDTNGLFFDLQKTTGFWSSSENGSSLSWYRDLLYDDAELIRSCPNKFRGHPIRCLRN